MNIAARNETGSLYYVRKTEKHYAYGKITLLRAYNTRVGLQRNKQQNIILKTKVSAPCTQYWSSGAIILYLKKKSILPFPFLQTTGYSTPMLPLSLIHISTHFVRAETSVDKKQKCKSWTERNPLSRRGLEQGKLGHRTRGFARFEASHSRSANQLKCHFLFLVSFSNTNTTLTLSVSLTHLSPTNQSMSTAKKTHPICMCVHYYTMNTYTRWALFVPLDSSITWGQHWNGSHESDSKTAGVTLVPN